MDSDFDFGFSHRHKRSHAQMENEGSSSPTWHSFRGLSASREPSNGGPSHQHLSGLHLPRFDNMPSGLHTRRRFPGDGFDFRRPVSLSRSDSQLVIDLTLEDAAPALPTAPDNRQPAPARPQRPPRFSRDIIAVSDDEDEEERDSEQEPARIPSDSPEIEFIRARRIEPQHQGPAPQHGNNPDEDDVQIVGENVLPGEPHDIGAILANQEYLQRQIRAVQAMRRAQQAHVGMRLRHHQIMHPAAPPRGRPRAHVHVGFIAPNLDFDMVGFDVGRRPASPPRAPTYNAPDPAPEGFTRTPGDEAFVCPNCEEELCIGDSDVKRQVWIAKQCGHMYCGRCATNRFTKRSSKGKERVTPADHKPFKECVVEGCHKRISNPSAMIQVFL
ncbi:hypothetical protein K491DRAFT_776001 [Lophiostoma macrostomum CBS 122681]|uniref:RING-type domain-containing protein n=1 Tax=Lophiostoma macrostomum CBS 122681 TaxID=1314788 RepID=A0A6A6TFU0_9PLEO|nr:hypothetical protein K491DRAFT_776001 [Lophiostoma macrostomum CBS 122681]